MEKIKERPEGVPMYSEVPVTRCDCGYQFNACVRWDLQLEKSEVEKMIMEDCPLCDGNLKNVYEENLKVN